MSDDQTRTIEFLARPETLGDGSTTVERAETHISVVFIGRERVLKLKRAVKFPFLDFSTAEARREACEAEVRINRRTAPRLYRGVLPVTRTADGGLELDGDGEAVDWVIDMVAFEQSTLFDRQARRGVLDRSVMESLAAIIAEFHQDAEVRDDLGGSAGIGSTLGSNEATLAQASEGVLDMEAVARLNAQSREALERVAPLLDARKAAGKVRRCHGDLHLRNIFLYDGRPTLFDAIEFNEGFAVIDVLYDLSFLLMDLDVRDLRRLSSMVFNRYLDTTGDIDGLAAMPLFLAMRATIRAFVNAAASHAVDDAGKKAEMGEEARAYLNRALGYLNPPAPRVVAVGGLSGSGKSRLAREIAGYVGAAPGARVVRSDVVRKRLAGVDPLTRLGPDGYSAEMSKRTYDAVFDEARAVVATGHSAILDVVFADQALRERAEALAGELGVPFNGLWLEAPPEVMEMRVTKRRNNVSDADVSVLRRQREYDLGTISWDRVDSSSRRDRTLKRALRNLGIRG